MMEQVTRPLLATTFELLFRLFHLFHLLFDIYIIRKSKRGVVGGYMF